MEIRPAGDLGGGASTASRHPAAHRIDRITLLGYVTGTVSSEGAGEDRETGTTAGSVAWIRQQAGVTVKPCCAIPSQQAGRAVECIINTQADAGIAVHATTASISNATFLHQGIVGVFQFQLQLSIPELRGCVSLVTPVQNRTWFAAGADLSKTSHGRR